MRTVFGSLPFYDSLVKLDVNRTKAIMPIHCPRTQLPPFQMALGSDTIATVDKIELISKNYTGTEETIATDWVGHTTFETFTHTGLNISSAINASGTADAATDVLFSLNRGEQIRIKGTLTINSGVAPKVIIYSPGATATLAVGANDIILTSLRATSSFLVALNVSAAANFSFTGVTITKISNTYNITDYFPTLPQPYTPTDASLDPYLKYNGDTLNWLLPLGVYYVKISGDDYVYYSDYIRVDNLYGNLITGWANYSYETFSTSGTIILSAIETGSSGTARSSTSFDLIKGESIKIIFFHTQTSGALPKVYLWRSPAEYGDFETAAAGLNEMTLTAQVSGEHYIRFLNSAASNFSTSEVVVIRSYTPNFLKINFRNTDNFGDLLYEESQKQTVWLEAVLNNPTHEMVNVGDEKDGIFIAEKITSKYIHSIIAYISRSLYNCLVRLPQHDSITITDEVGNDYTPAAGNVTVDPIDWSTYETGRLVIRFNNGSYSSFSWTT